MVKIYDEDLFDDEIKVCSFYFMSFFFIVGFGIIVVFIMLGVNMLICLLDWVILVGSVVLGVVFMVLVIFFCYNYVYKLVLLMGWLGIMVVLCFLVFILLCIGI